MSGPPRRKTVPVSDSANALIGYLLGSYLLDFLIRGTRLQPLAALLDLLVAGVFIYNLPVGDQDGPSPRPGKWVAEVITGAWSTAGLGGMLVWMWFFNLRKVTQEAMAKAEGWNRSLFWGLIVVGLIAGVYPGLRRSRKSGPGHADTRPKSDPEV